MGPTIALIRYTTTMISDTVIATIVSGISVGGRRRVEKIIFDITEEYTIRDGICREPPAEGGLP